MQWFFILVVLIGGPFWLIAQIGNPNADWGALPIMGLLYLAAIGGVWVKIRQMRVQQAQQRFWLQGQMPGRQVQPPPQPTLTGQRTPASGPTATSRPPVAGVSSFCPKCGTQRTGSFRFCRSCGYDFDGVS